MKKNFDSFSLIIDDPEMGFLQLGPESKKIGKVLVVSKDIDVLKVSRLEIGRSKGIEAQFINADPDRLPFKEASINEFIIFDHKKGGPCIEGKHLGENSELSRIKTNDAWIVTISLVSDKDSDSPTNNTGLSESRTRRSFFVRPKIGEEYFVTKHYIPSDWPFDFLQLGLLKRMRIAFGLLVSKMGINFSPNCVYLQIQSETKGFAPVDKWENIKSSGSHNKEKIPEQCFDGLYVKALRNALLVGLEYPNSSSEGVVVKFPLSHAAEVGLRSNATNLFNLHSEIGGTLKDLLPIVLREGGVNGQVFWVESKCEGVAATRYWWKPSWKRKTMRSAYKFLVELHQSTKRKAYIDEILFDTLLKSDIELMENECRRFCFDYTLAPLEKILRKTFVGRSLTLVRTHGDYCPGNLLVSKRGDVVGVIDWEASVKHGWPVLDLINLIVFQNKFRACRYFGSQIINKLMKRRFGFWEHEMLNQYCSSFSIDDDLWLGLVAVYWIKVVSLWIQTTDSEKWIIKNAIRPYSEILRRVSNQYG